MGKVSALELQFPAGGLLKRYSYQQQPPFTTPSCNNVRPTETLEGRQRGGSRPGLGKAFYQQLGSGNPVRMINSVGIVQEDGRTFLEDSFEGSSLGDAWTVANWGGLVLPSIFPINYADVTFGVNGGAVHSALSNFDTSLPYLLEIFISPYQGAHHGTYSIFARMNNNTPVATTNGLVIELTMTGTGGGWTGRLRDYSSGTPTDTSFTSGNHGSPQAGWFSVLINGNNVSCTWLGTSVLGSTAVSAAAGARFGFGMNCTVSGGVCLVDAFRVQYQTNNNSQARRRLLVSSSNGTLYRETYLSTLEALTSNLSLASDRQLQTAERAQRLYIADNGNPAATGTDGVRGTGNDRLDAASVADWTAIGANIHDYVVVISNGTGGGAIDGTYTISAIASGELTLGSNWCTGGGATCDYRVERAPKIYNPIADTLTLLTATAGLGQVPTGCPLMCIWQDRLTLAGAPVAPHVWYMSRQGNFQDWDFAADETDRGRAIAGTTSSNTGAIFGEAMTCLAPHSDDYLFFGYASSLWVLRGNPTLGGQLDNLSRIAGIVDKRAWCKGPNGEFVYLSRDGLYSVNPGGGYPVSLSRERLPIELRDVDSSAYTVLLAYDSRDRGVHIYLTPVADRGQTHYWFDWQTRGFWPLTLQGEHEPHSIHEYVSESSSASAVLLGCRDGYIRRYKDDYEEDDGEPFTSFYYYGPIMLGDGYNDGIIREIIGSPGANSGDVDWSLYVGETAEQAFNASAFETGSWDSTGLNYKARPRGRGAAMYLKVTNGETRRWSMERVMISREKIGAQLKI